MHKIKDLDLVISVITAPFSTPDGFRYKGTMRKLPHHIRIVSGRKLSMGRSTQQAIQTAQQTAEKKRTVMQSIDQNAARLEDLGLEEIDLIDLKDEVNGFLES